MSDAQLDLSFSTSCSGCGQLYYDAHSQIGAVAIQATTSRRRRNVNIREQQARAPSTPPLQRVKAPRAVRRPTRSKRKWSAPLRVEGFEDKLREAGKKTCCARIGCLSRFASGKDTLYDPGLLKTEQDKMETFECEQDRKRFVKERAPLVPLSGGTMYAANSQVCTFAFTKLFGVSKSLVDSAKNLSGALSSSETRR